jgi:hypothetical protein
MTLNDKKYPCGPIQLTVSSFLCSLLLFVTNILESCLIYDLFQIGWLGRTSVIVSYATIILGLRQYGASLTVIYAVSGSIALFFLIYIYLDLYRWKEKKDGRAMYDSADYD